MYQHCSANKSYFAICLDNNTRKPLCRLYFNTKQKYIGIFDKEKNMTKYPITSLDDIYSFAEELVENTKIYLTIEDYKEYMKEEVIE